MSIQVASILKNLQICDDQGPRLYFSDNKPRYQIGINGNGDTFILQGKENVKQDRALTAGITNICIQRLFGAIFLLSLSIDIA